MKEVKIKEANNNRRISKDDCNSNRNYSQSTYAPTAPSTKPKSHRLEKVAATRKYDSLRTSIRPEKQWSELHVAADAKKHGNQIMRKDTARSRSTSDRLKQKNDVQRKNTAEESMRKETAEVLNSDIDNVMRQDSDTRRAGEGKNDRIDDDMRHEAEEKQEKLHNQLVCYYTNLQSIMNKRAELQATIDELKPEIIGITESWCNKTIVDAEIAIEGYSMFRLDKDTPTGIGGGIILYVKDTLTAVACHKLNDVDMESSIWCLIQLESSENLLVGLCYRSPNTSTEENDDKLRRQIDSIKEVQNVSHLLLMGDFNFPEIDWINNRVKGSQDSEPQRFFDLIQDEFLVQHVSKPTRVRGNQKPSLIDLVISRDENEIDEIQYLAPLGCSDHEGLAWTYVTHSSLKTAKEGGLSQNYKKGDYKEIKKHFSNIDWEANLEGMKCEEAWSKFKEEYNKATEDHIPLKKQKKSKPPWLRAGVKRSIKKKYKLFQKYKKTRRYKDYQEYTKQRDKTKKQIRQAQADHERRLMKEFKKKPKAFFSYVRAKQNVKVGVSQLDKEDGTLTQNDDEAANVLNEFFRSVYTREPEGDPPSPQPRDINHEDPGVKFTIEDVIDKLRGLKPDKSPGIDSIHPYVLRECAEVMAIPLYHIYQKSMEEGVVPEDWRQARVVPIFKKGSKSKASNYRPVSLTSVPCKVMESLVRDAVLDHVNINNLLSAEQHGFTSGRSCLTNLLVTLEEITKYLDEGLGVDVIYLDYSKAFDTVPHKRLISKLTAYGINGKVIKWIQEFLSNRRQQVGVRGELSSWAEVISGVPQGSVLGPILFVLYINNLPDIVTSTAKLFADDTKLYNQVTNNNSEGSDQIQEDLKKLEKWSDTWLLRFNASKCKCMHMGHDNPNRCYTLNGETITAVDEEKDLGVHLSSDCKPSLQCTKAAGKAMQSLRIIKRTFNYIDKEGFAILYRAYIRPHLEYCVQAWCPYLQKDIKCLERVQRRATKLVSCLREKSYEERLEELNLYPLEVRRVRGDIIEVFKILNGLEDIDASELFTMSDMTTRGHNMKIFKKRLSKGLNLRRFFFSQRVIDNWNHLPENVVNTKTTNQFKNSFDNYLKEYGYGVLKGISLY